MTTAFQSNAFQDDAFQIDGGAVVQVVSARGSGRLAKAWWKRKSGIYWPKKISKKVVEEIIDEAVAELPVAQQQGIDTGVLAQRIFTSVHPGALRALEQREQFIAMIVRELEEQDDEEVIMWLLDD